MNIAHHADAAGSDTPAINDLTEEALALDRAGAMLQTAATLIAVTRRSLEDRPPDSQVDAPQTEANGEGRGIQECGQADYPVAATNKQFATLAALAARNGITLIALADGNYLLCRWGLSRALPDLCVVASLLRRMGVSV